MGGVISLQLLMNKVICWNIRGLNSPSKQNVVRSFIQAQSAGLVSLLETRVKVSNMGNLYLSVCPGWCFTSNAQFHKGGRIVVFWNPNFFDVNILKCTSQLVHCHVKPRDRQAEYYSTFIYAFNDAHSRKALCMLG